MWAKHFKMLRATKDLNPVIYIYIHREREGETEREREREKNCFNNSLEHRNT